MGLVVLVVGVIGIGAVIGAVAVFAALRSRRNFGRDQTVPGMGAYPQHLGYPPQQPSYPNIQQPYPSPPNQGDTDSPAQFPPHSNAYPQQPRHPG